MVERGQERVGGGVVEGGQENVLRQIKHVYEHVCMCLHKCMYTCVIPIQYFSIAFADAIQSRLWRL